jgi:hypothetical protein
LGGHITYLPELEFLVLLGKTQWLRQIRVLKIEFNRILNNYLIFLVLQTERGKVSLEEFRALANQKPAQRDCIGEDVLENLDDEVFSLEEFEDTEEISISIRDK